MRTRTLVTGASRGIGAAIAHALAARGDQVAVHYGTRAESAREVLRALPGDGHVLVAGDLADPTEVAGLVAAVVEGRAGWTCWSTTPPRTTRWGSRSRTTRSGRRPGSGCRR